MPFGPKQKSKHLCRAGPHRRLRVEPLEPRRLLAGVPIITELMADNNATLADEDGDFSDWIEIHNAGDAAVELAGWHLTDRADDPTQWTFPATTLPAGDYLTVFASNKNRLGTGPLGELHTNFRLAADGEYLALIAPDGHTAATEFAPAYPPQRPDIAYGRGQALLPERFVAEGDAATVRVPTDDSLASTWTGDAAQEPFDDSESAGWLPATLGVGYDTGQSDPGESLDTETVGAALTARGSLDTALGSIFLLDGTPLASNGQLTDWAMYSTTTATITPLLLRSDGGGGFDIVGIGQTRTSDGTGVQQFSFGLVDGSDEALAGDRFGWKDGGNGTNNTGVAPYDGTGGTVRWFGQHTTFTAGENIGGGVLITRTYSVQATITVTGGPDPVDPLRPMAYWDFDGGAIDQTGNGHTGQINGAAPDADVPPHAAGGASLRFDGVDDYVSVQIDVSETAYTASLWFKADSPDRGLFTVTDNDLGGGGYDRLLYLAGTNMAARVWDNETIATSGLNLVDGGWHHVAHVFGGETGGQAIYIDGQLAASGLKANSDFDWQQRINIGFSNDGAGDYFHGLIDEVAVWDRELTAEQVEALAVGATPLALSGLAPWITTDLTDAMAEQNASAYVRTTFQADLPVDFDGLKLRMKYDDGFIAYLNGVEVARRNAPASAGFDAAATADRPISQVIQFEEIDISTHVPLLRSGTNVLALHAMNDAADGAEFLLLPELAKLDADADRYLLIPTPGAENGSGVVDFVAEVDVSPPRGLYDVPQQVALATATAGADILVTLDGSVPQWGNPAAQVYSGPIAIDFTATLRVAAFKDEHQPADVQTHTYVFVDSVADQPAHWQGGAATLPGPGGNGFAGDYAVDPNVLSTTLPGYGFRDALLSLPTVSITTDPENLFDPTRGIYYHSTSRGPSWERPASMELIYPDGQQGFQVDAGIRMHGNSSRVHGFTPKHPIRVMFKSQYGAEKLEFPLFGIERFDQLLLRGASTDSWPVVDGNFVLGVQRWNRLHATYFRDQYMRDAQLALGQPSANGTHVHLYLNGLYWGLYNLAERPTDSFNAEHLGGNKDEYDVLKDFAELQSGSVDAWNEMIALANAGLATDAAYQRIQGNDPDGTPNPAYPVYLDVDNLIDYMILHIHSGAEDWPDHNWWTARRRGPESEGFQFFVWDQEIANDSLIRTHTRIQTPFEDPIGTPSPSFLYGKAMENDTFRQKFIDRVQELLFNGGTLSPEKNMERWEARVAELDQAMVAESARWGDSKREPPLKREVEWLAEMEWMRNEYWPQIRDIALQRFRNVGLYPDVDAPVFHVDGQPQHGGLVPPDAAVTLTVSQQASLVDVPLVDLDAPVAAVVPTDATLGVQWRLGTYVEGSLGESWLTGTNGVGYENGSGYQNEIHIDVGAGMSGPGGNNSVFVRLPFTVDDQGSLDAFQSLELRILADDGFVAFLNGQQSAQANDPSPLAFDSASPVAIEVNVASPSVFDVSAFIGQLQVGQNMLAIHGLNQGTDSSDMLIRAELVAQVESEGPGAETLYYTTDGSDPMAGGGTLFATPIPIAEPVRIKSRQLAGGQWSALTEATFTAYPPADDSNLAVSEIHFNPSPPTPAELAVEPLLDNDDFEFIELRNIADVPIYLGGVQFVAGEPIEFAFDDASLANLAPGATALIVANLDAFHLRYGTSLDDRIAGEFTAGRLNNGGEAFSLLAADGGVIRSFAYDDAAPWPSTADGVGFSLVLNDPAGNPDHANPFNWRASAAMGGSPGAVDPLGPARIVVSEALTNSDGQLLDTIELFNPTGGDVDIGGWLLTDNENLPHKYRIADATIIPADGYLTFDETQFNAPGDPNGFALGSGGDEVFLFSADPVSGALTGHEHGFAFTAAADSVAFIRHVDSTGYEHFVAQADPGTSLGGPNQPFRVGEVVITELHYNPKTSDPGETFVDEFIEIQNISAAAVPLYDPQDPANTWVVDGAGYAFPSAASLAPGEVALVVGVDPEAFRATYALPAEVQIFGPFAGSLSDGGETISLQRPTAPSPDTPLIVPLIDVDVVRFDDDPPWTTLPDGGNGDGSSLNRVAADEFGSDPVSWIAAEPTPGAALTVQHVVGRHLFYGNSAYDAVDPAGAIAVDKSSLLPGEQATFANYSNFDQGINGLIVDVLNPNTTPDPGDFGFRVGNVDDTASWQPAPPTASFDVAPGGGAFGSTRVTITWADGAIAGTWLETTIVASLIGRATDDVFYYGSAIGEVGNDPANALVTAADLIAIRNHPRGDGNRADITSPHDVNRDRLVNATDLLLARNHATGPFDALRLIIPSLPSVAPPEAEGEGSDASSGLSAREFDAATHPFANTGGQAARAPRSLLTSWFGLSKRGFDILDR